MEEIDLGLPSKFIDASVDEDFDKALKIVKLIAKQHRRTLTDELKILSDSAAMVLSIDEMTAVFSMVEDIRKYEAQRSINYCSRDADLLRCSRICRVCLMSDLKYQKGEWYHVQEDGTLKSVDYDKEVEEYYKKWRDNYGN